MGTRREAIPYAGQHLKPTDAVAIGVYPKNRPGEIAEDVALFCQALEGAAEAVTPDAFA